MRRVLLATSILVAVAGCTRYWARPGTTVAERTAAEDTCEADALTRFPLAPPVYGYTPALGSQCSRSPAGISCTTYDGTELDLNAQSRSVAFRACMVDAGWRPAKDDGGAEAMSRLRRILDPPAPGTIREARAWCDKMFHERRNAEIMAAFHNSVDQCVVARSRDID